MYGGRSGPRSSTRRWSCARPTADAGRRFDRDRRALSRARAPAVRNPELNRDINAVTRAIVVENKWRAQRYGVHGTFVGENGAITVAEMMEQVIEEVSARRRRARLPRGDAALPRDRRRRHLGGRADGGVRARQDRRPRPRARCSHRLDRGHDAAVDRLQFRRQRRLHHQAPGARIDHAEPRSAISVSI